MSPTRARGKARAKTRVSAPARDAARDRGASLLIPPDLTRNQMLVLDCLIEARRAMSVDQVLDALRPQGLSATSQVRRPLTVLMRRELVHRIDSLKAYVACRHRDHGAFPAFAICEDCRQIWEFTLPRGSDLTALAREKGFEAHRAVIELRGRCAACRAR